MVELLRHTIYCRTAEKGHKLPANQLHKFVIVISHIDFVGMLKLQVEKSECLVVGFVN